VAIRSLALKCRRLLEEASKLASWAPAPVKYWEVSVAPTTTFFALCPVPEVSTPDHLAFLTPPPHIFTRRQGPAGGYDSDDDRKPNPARNVNRCHTLLFIWVCIRRFWQSRLDAAFVNGTFDTHESISEYRLGTRKWKDLLHANAFRKSGKDEFDIQQFWTYGDIFGIQAFFEDANPVPQVLGRALTPIDFQYDALKALVVWDASLTSAKYQFEEADNILMRGARLSPASTILRCAKRTRLFRDSYNIPSAPHPSQSDSVETRQDWVCEFCGIISDWPQYSRWKNPPPKPEREVISKLDFKQLDGFLGIYIPIYYQGIFDALRTTPTPLLIRPDTSVLNPDYLLI